MMTPADLAILILFFPQVNLVTMRVSELVGLPNGMYQMMFTSEMNFSEAWWGGVLHLPLVSVSIFALVLAYGMGLCRAVTQARKLVPLPS